MLYQSKSLSERDKDSISLEAVPRLMIIHLQNRFEGSDEAEMLALRKGLKVLFQLQQRYTCIGIIRRQPC